MGNIMVKTERLVIRPQSMEEMIELCGHEPDGEMKAAYREMTETMRRFPGREEWGTQWRIMLSSGRVVGGLCFKGPPDLDGIVEVGYGIDEAYQNRGFATEAVTGIVKWAFGQTGVSGVAAQTDRDNVISGKVLVKCGFVRDGYGQEGPLYKIYKDNGRNHYEQTENTDH